MRNKRYEGRELPTGVTIVQNTYKYKGKDYKYDPSYIYDYYINGRRNRIHKKSLEEIIKVKKQFKMYGINENETANRLFLSYIQNQIPELYEELIRDFRAEVGAFSIKDSIKHESLDDFLNFAKEEIPDTFDMLLKEYKNRRREQQ